MKTYDSYKDSGIEWIGEIPNHWQIKKVKNFTQILTGSTPKSTDDSYWNGNINWVTTDDLGKLDSQEIFESRRKITEAGFQNSGTYLAPIDSIVLSTRAPIGHLGILKIEACTNQGCKTIVSNNNFDSRFLYYLLFAGKSYLNSLGVGTTFLELPSQSLKDFYTPFPSKEEQSAIASYLNQKTAEIDELIADKKRLLELYEEEKTAVINQAVTKGLDPNSPMKDSGIEWLGEIPENWEVMRLKYVGKTKYGLGQPPKQKIDGLPIIRATNVFRGKIDEKDLVFVDPDDIPYERDPILRTDDIIVVRSGAYTADSAIIPSKYDGAVTGYDMVFRCNENFFPKFVAFGLLSDYILKRQLIMHSLRAAQPHLNREELGETIIAVPSFEEQKTIVQKIETECSAIEAKKAKTQKLINLLTEYRTALISEVVTGKIKVTD